MKKDIKNKKIKRLSKSDVRTEIIKLEELEKLSVEEQEKTFEDIFDRIYKGEEIESLLMLHLVSYILRVPFASKKIRFIC